MHVITHRFSEIVSSSIFVCCSRVLHLPRVRLYTTVNSSEAAPRIPDSEKSGSRADPSAVPQTKENSDKKRKKVVVVGGGWAGFGAAKALTEAGPYDVILLDANPNPGGESPPHP